MMIRKIHTTQNLNSLGRMQSTNNDTIPNDEIRLNYSEQMRKLKLSEEPNDVFTGNVSFTGKSLPELAKRIKDTTSKRASDKKGIKDKVLSSARFGNMLKFILNNEVMTGAITAFGIGWLFRVPAIMAIPEWLGGKHKEDKAMAAAHSGASVTIGLLTAALLTLPAGKAMGHVREQLYQKIEPKLLKARHPQLKIESMKDSTGKLLKKEFWKNWDGKPFNENIKTPMTIARPKYCGDIAESTFKSMGIDIDMTKNASKPAMEMTLKDGRKLIDALEPKDMYIAIKEEGMGTTLKGLKDTNFFSLEYIDKDFLSKSMPELDINTAFVNGKITHPTKWMTKDKKPIKDLDIYISNYLETAESTPVYTGAKRFEADGTPKYVCYQNNGEGGLGTPITDKMIEADKNVDTTNKVVKWTIDILTKIPVGLCTVALIPKILDMFTFLKKNKKADIKQQDLSQNIAQANKLNDNLNQNTKPNNVSFKGKKEPNKFIKWISDKYVLPILNNDKIQKLSEKLNKRIKMSTTTLMTIFGSFLMSSSYVCGTLTNKNFKKDKDRRNTLAINQALGFIVPTLLGIWVSGKIQNRIKGVTYEYVGKQTQRIKLLAQSGKISKDEEAKALKAIASSSKGISILGDLTVFTFIYRFFTPVAITPVANFLGDKYNNWKKPKNANQQQTQEIELKPNDENKKLTTAA